MKPRPFLGRTLSAGAASGGSDERPSAPEVPTDPLPADGRRMYQLDTRPPEALVIHCGDPRFQTAFRRFITEELGIDTYTPVVFGGGAQAFGAHALVPKNFKVLWAQAKFFIKEGGLRQVILINHEDCLWYRHMQGYHPTIDLLTKQKLDLHHAARMLLEDFAGIQVRSYWAALDGDRVYFVPMESK